jgi:hypothetical protein
MAQDMVWHGPQLTAHACTAQLTANVTARRFPVSPALLQAPGLATSCQWMTQEQS